METRKNTLKIVFGIKEKVPSYLDVLRFVAKDLGLPASRVHTIYKDENEQCYFLKLMDRESFNIFYEAMEDNYWFSYADGQRTVVALEMASRQMRYIQIFNLPPEAEDKEIEKVLSRFGKIRQHIRERYPVSSEFSVYSGVRGVYMEVEKEIPAGLFIGHFKARIYYEGLKNKCFFCKIEGHLKANCPKLAGLRNDDAEEVLQGNDQKTVNEAQPNRLYSQVVANLQVAKMNTTDTNTNMTNIPLTKRSINAEAAKLSLNVTHTNNNNEQSVNSPNTENERTKNEDNTKQQTHTINESSEADEAASKDREGEQNEPNKIRMTIDWNDGAVGGDEYCSDETMKRNTTTISPNKRPSNDVHERLDELNLLEHGKGTVAKKKGSPLEALRDRSRSQNRRSRK